MDKSRDDVVLSSTSIAHWVGWEGSVYVGKYWDVCLSSLHNSLLISLGF